MKPLKNINLSEPRRATVFDHSLFRSASGPADRRRLLMLRLREIDRISNNELKALLAEAAKLKGGRRHRH